MRRRRRRIFFISSEGSLFLSLKKQTREITRQIKKLKGEKVNKYLDMQKKKINDLLKSDMLKGPAGS